MSEPWKIDVSGKLKGKADVSSRDVHIPWHQQVDTQP